MWLVLLEQETDWNCRLLPMWDSSPGYLSSMYLGVISFGVFFGGRDLLWHCLWQRAFPRIGWGRQQTSTKRFCQTSLLAHRLKLVLPLQVHCFSLCLVEFSARVGKRELLEAQLALGVLWEFLCPKCLQAWSRYKLMRGLWRDNGLYWCL